MGKFSSLESGVISWSKNTTRTMFLVIGLVLLVSWQELCAVKGNSPRSTLADPQDWFLYQKPGRNKSKLLDPLPAGVEKRALTYWSWPATLNRPRKERPKTRRGRGPRSSSLSSKSDVGTFHLPSEPSATPRRPSPEFINKSHISDDADYLDTSFGGSVGSLNSPRNFPRAASWSSTTSANQASPRGIEDDANSSSPRLEASWD